MEDTIFHKIARKEVPADLVYEDERVVAFRDINPVAPVHILVVPRATLPRLSDAGPDDAKLLGHLFFVAAEVARKEGLEAGGYRVVVNNGKDACQTVFQLHLHVIGGRTLGWPPG